MSNEELLAWIEDLQSDLSSNSDQSTLKFELTGEQMEEYRRLKEKEDRRLAAQAEFIAQPCRHCGQSWENCNRWEP